MEPLPLGIDAAAAVAPGLDIVVRLRRSSRAAQVRLRAVVSARHESFVFQRLDRRQPLILGNSRTGVRIVRVRAATKDPTRLLHHRLRTLLNTCIGTRIRRRDRARQREAPINDCKRSSTREKAFIGGEPEEETKRRAECDTALRPANVHFSYRPAHSSDVADFATGVVVGPEPRTNRAVFCGV